MTANGTDEAAAGLAVGMGLVFIIIFSVVGFILYILPGIIASMRRHPQAVPIWLVTIFLGWSGIAWFAALIWSFITPQPAVALTMAMPAQPYPPQPYPPVAAPTPAPTAGSAMADEIAALARLRDQGVLTEAEFTARKQLLLGDGAAAPVAAAPVVQPTVVEPPVAEAPPAPEAPVIATAPEPHPAPNPPPADAL